MRLYHPGDWKLYVELAVLSVLLWACAPVKCQKLEVVIDRLDTQKAPAGKLTLRCDGLAIVEAQAATLTVGQ